MEEQMDEVVKEQLQHRRSTLPYDFFSSFKGSELDLADSATRPDPDKLKPESPRDAGFATQADFAAKAPLVFPGGITTATAAAFLACVVAGHGELGMAKTLSQLGWMGAFFFLLSYWNAMYSNLCLGRCWIMMEKRWPEYRKAVRNPYPQIGYRAAGTWMKYVVSVTVNISLTCVCIVSLLVGASIMQTVFRNEASCYWIVLLAIIVLPFTFLGTPRRFGCLAFLNVIVSEFAICLMIVHVLLIRSDRSLRFGYPRPDAATVTEGVGTVIYFFAGSAVFPTVHNDMRFKKRVFDAAVSGYIGSLSMYLPLMIFGYAAFGEKLESDIIRTMATYSRQPGLAALYVFLYVVHTLMSFLLMFNPIAQDVEEYLHCSKKFDRYRCLVRSCLVLLILLLALCFPNFTKIFKLIVGLTTSFLSMIFPPVFYIILMMHETRENPKRKIGAKTMAILVEILLMGLVMGGASTYSAIRSISQTSGFGTSCYKGMNLREIHIG